MFHWVSRIIIVHISILLCNYSKLKEDSWCNFNNDLKWLMFDLDTAVDNALKEKYFAYFFLRMREKDVYILMLVIC